MIVKLKTKITKKGNLCICITDKHYPQNNEVISIIDSEDLLVKNEIKTKRFIKVLHIGQTLEKDNQVSSRHRQKITDTIEKLKNILEKNGVIVEETISQIEYKNNTPLLRSQQRSSCKGSWIDIFELF